MNIIKAIKTLCEDGGNFTYLQKLTLEKVLRALCPDDEYKSMNELYNENCSLKKSEEINRAIQLAQGDKLRKLEQTIRSLEESLIAQGKLSNKMYDEGFVPRIEYDTLKTKFENYIMNLENILTKYEKEIKNG